jgi:hypothetical protein
VARAWLRRGSGKAGEELQNLAGLQDDIVHHYGYWSYQKSESIGRTGSRFCTQLSLQIILLSSFNAEMVLLKN